MTPEAAPLKKDPDQRRGRSYSDAKICVIAVAAAPPKDWTKTVFGAG